MQPKQLGLTSQSSSIGFADLVRVAAAISKQIARDLAPIWDVSGVVTALPDPAAIPPGVWPIFIQDDIGFADAAGLHLTDHKQPFALVEAGHTWSLTASHECLEMLVDPSGNWLIPSAGVAVTDSAIADLPHQKFEYLVEVADPSEEQTNAYMIDDVLVSDFYTPHFYDPEVSPGTRYSFSGKIGRPREVLPGGYLSWWNPMLNTMQQLRWGSGPEIVDIPGHPSESARTTLRGFIDSKTAGRPKLSKLPSRSNEVARRDRRAAWLSVAAAHRGATYALARRITSAVRPPLPSADDARAVLANNVRQLTAAGGTKAYIGWRFVNDWVTRARAIVVWARPAEVDAVRNRLPTNLGGFPVEVRRDPRPELPPLPNGALRFHAMAEGTVRGEDSLPPLDGQTFLREEQPDAAALEAARHTKPHVQYAPPAGVSLDRITENMSLTLHISPEQGWAQLEPFLISAAQSLTIGMYELTAPHIDRALSTLAAPETLKLTLDSPPERPGKREQTVEKSEQDLRQGLRQRFNFAWALSGGGTESIGNAFQTSYHIKVAVKDDASFWLSSGNFNTANQPVVDTSDTEALTQAVLDHDRDWHVICECPTLAQTFKAFLLADFTLADDFATNGAAAMRAAIAPVRLDFPLEALGAKRLRPKKFFAPLVINRAVTVQPILTPDNYRKPILDLMNNATTRFYMQTQYIKVAGENDPADPSGTAHTDLLKGLTGMIARGLDVRLITSEYQTKADLEALLNEGIDIIDQLRIQTGVHNKGIVVDTEIAVVSSQNWSGLGTWKNRDAGVILFDAEAARYFETIFLHDWENLARQAVRP